MGKIKVKFFEAMRTVMHQRNHYVADEKMMEDQADFITNMRLVTLPQSRVSVSPRPPPYNIIIYM